MSCMRIKYLGPAATVVDGSGTLRKAGEVGDFGAGTIRLMRLSGHVFEGIGPEGGEEPDKGGAYPSLLKLEEDTREEAVLTAEAPGHGVLGAEPTPTASVAATAGAAAHGNPSPGRVGSGTTARGG